MGKGNAEKSTKGKRASKRGHDARRSEAVIAKALALLQPGAHDPLAQDAAGIMRRVKDIIGTIEKQIAAQGVSAQVMLGGSLAKQTNLPGDHDVDLFVVFDTQKHHGDDLSELLERLLTPFGVERLHGSRDYFQISGDEAHAGRKSAGKAPHPGQRRMNVEIVPVLRIASASEARNVTDCSPLHVDWFAKQCRKRPGLSDQVRLAKQFCKAARCYGAESYIRGFSGHVLDILCAHYGSFAGLLEASRCWKEQHIIDSNDVHKGNALHNLNTAKIESGLIVIDPLDPSRNAAAALDWKQCRRFMDAADTFLRKPSLSAFTKTPRTPETLLRQAGKDILLLVAFRSLPGKRDVVGSKLVKALTHLERQLEANDFHVREADMEWDGAPENGKGLFFFIVKKEKRGTHHILEGPPARAREHAKRFRERHASVVEKDGRLYAKETYAFASADAALRTALRDPYVKERVKSARLSG